ncbi:MAG: hypothetical protein ACYDCI_11235 [Candidatus Limnocylindrales bacterium]
MRDFGAVLSREFDLDGLGHAALEGLLRHTGSEAGAILVAREDRMEPLATHGLRETDGLAENDHVRRVLRLDRTEHLQIDAPDAVIDSLLVGQAAREILVAPVTFKSVPLGVIVLATTGQFERDVVDLLEQLRSDLGLAINNALTHDRLERLAAVDPLTETYNRRFGLARLREEFSRAVRAENPLGVLMSTSITSSRSTTPTGTSSAIASFGPSPPRAGESSAMGTSSSATVARSSSCCCPGPAWRT